MAVNMAIGFILLGYGNYTFNTNDMSIAALLISIFPQFPNKKLVQIKIRDPDYFDVDFAFVNTKNEPKAIYIKRKYFKDVNPKMLNP